MTIFSLFFLASTSLAVFALTVNPVVDVVQCKVSLLTWRDGTAPYNLSICPADNPSGPALVNLGTETSTSCLWTANLPAGVSAVLEVRDSAGNSAQSSSFTVQLGSENNCLKSTDTTDITTSASTSETASPGSGSVLTSSASSATGGIMNASQNTSSTNTGAASFPSTAAAASHYIPVGTLTVSGVVALAVALVL